MLKIYFYLVTEIQFATDDAAIAEKKPLVLRVTLKNLR